MDENFPPRSLLTASPSLFSSHSPLPRTDDKAAKRPATCDRSLLGSELDLSNTAAFFFATHAKRAAPNNTHTWDSAAVVGLSFASTGELWKCQKRECTNICDEAARQSVRRCRLDLVSCCANIPEQQPFGLESFRTADDSNFPVQGIRDSKRGILLNSFSFFCTSTNINGVCRTDLACCDWHLAQTNQRNGLIFVYYPKRDTGLLVNSAIKLIFPIWTGHTMKYWNFAFALRAVLFPSRRLTTAGELLLKTTRRIHFHII